MTFGFEQWLIIGLLITLFFKDEAKAFLRHRMGLSEPAENLQAGVDYLKMHYNDELTEKLTEIHNDQKEGFKSSFEKQDAAKKCIERANIKLEEFDKFGIKARV